MPSKSMIDPYHSRRRIEAPGPPARGWMMYFYSIQPRCRIVLKAQLRPTSYRVL